MWDISCHDIALKLLETGLRPKVLATNNEFTNAVVPFLAVKTNKQTSCFKFGICNLDLQYLFIVLPQEESESIDQQCHVLRETPGTRRLLVGVETVINDK